MAHEQNSRHQKRLFLSRTAFSASFFKIQYSVNASSAEKPAIRHLEYYSGCNYGPDILGAWSRDRKCCFALELHIEVSEKEPTMCWNVSCFIVPPPVAWLIFVLLHFVWMINLKHTFRYYMYNATRDYTFGGHQICRLHGALLTA